MSQEYSRRAGRLVGADRHSLGWRECQQPQDDALSTARGIWTALLLAAGAWALLVLVIVGAVAILG